MWVVTLPELALGSIPSPEDIMTLGGNTGHSNLYGPGVQHDPQTPTYPQVLARTVGLYTALSGNSSH